MPDTQKNSEDKKDSETLDIVAKYGVIGLGATLGSAAHHSEPFRDGLEEIVTGNFDNIGETLISLVEALPAAVDDKTVYGIIGAYATKVVIDGFYFLRKIAGKPKNAAIEICTRATVYYAALTTGVAYSKNHHLFEDVLANAPGWYKEFIHAATSMHTIAMGLGIAGVSLIYAGAKSIARKIARGRERRQDYNSRER